MAEMLVVKVEGLKELEKKLFELGPKLERKGLRSAVSAGASVVKKAILANVNTPEDTGALKANVYSYRARGGQGEQVYQVGVRNGVAKYGNTKKNRSLGRAGKAYKTDGETFYWKFFEFGTEKLQARPFIRPAFESSKFEADRKIRDKLAQFVDKYAREK